jgi:hypothetical protein
VTRTHAADRARRRDRAATAPTNHMEEGACKISRTRENADASVDMDVVVEEVGSAPTFSDQDDDIGSLARELARGQRDLIDQFQRYAGMDAAEAAEAARTPRDRALERVRTAPLDQLSWSTLAQAARHDPTVTLEVWEQIKDAARQELASGHRTAQSLERAGTPWDRARFLALRDAFRADWQPRGGIESALVDLLAQSFAMYLRWMERLELYVETECKLEDSKLAREGYWMPPRIGEAKWMAWCMEQAEAAHRRFLMTLKSLQDLRRLPSVSIASVSQVNVAQQQVNVSSRKDGGGSRDCGFTEIM